MNLRFLRVWFVFGAFVFILSQGPVCAGKGKPVSSPKPRVKCDTSLYQAPAGDRRPRIDRSGETVLPNGRLLTPAGRHVMTAPHPFGMALSPDGSLLVTVNGGVGPFSLTLVRDPASSSPAVTQIPPGHETNKAKLPCAFIGAAIDASASRIYCSGGDVGKIFVFDPRTGDSAGEIDLNSEQYPDSFPTDIGLSKCGRWLYVLDLANFRLATVDLSTSRVAGSVGVGRYPFGLAIEPDGRHAWVANMGTFQYSLAEVRPGDDERGLSFPPFGHPSREAREGTEVEGRRVPGLGDPNAPEACSVWGIDLVDPVAPRVTVKIKTGVPVGEAVGGSSPAAVAAAGKRLFVSNSVNDTVEAYDLATHKRVWRTLLTPAKELSELRGVQPFGLALDADGKRVYVAESGINAVGVLDAADGRVLGHIPACWYPSRVAVSPDGRSLFVANAKGFGSGPNGGASFKPGPEGRSVARLMKGAVLTIPVPASRDLAAMTRQVLKNNGMLKSAKGSSLPPVRHVVFIAKENRTFDEVFGDMPGVEGDASLARFGQNRTVDKAAGVDVMPNHRALAQRYALGDNFYVESDVSADGHHWLVNVYANHWVETLTASSYGDGAKFKRSRAPGRLAIAGSNASVMPEDYLEDGGLWEHLERHHIPFRNYGEGFELAGGSEAADMKPTGIRLPVNIPLPDALFRNTSREYPTFNMAIPDQYRADQFLRDFDARYLSGKEPLPALVYIFLPGDHGADARPDKGFPYLESYMADNDLALGRVVEALSRSPFWKDMAVFVCEDDAQGGIDHVDAHRSLVMVLGPWVRPGTVSHRLTSISSIFKTVYRLLGIPGLNLCDTLASDLSDVFDTTPHPEPYVVQPIDPRIFQPEKSRDPSDPDYRKAAAQPGVILDSPAEAEKQMPK